MAPEAIAVTGNGIALAVTLGVVGFLVRRVAGVGMALAAQLLVVVLVGFSPWMSVPYTDLPAMPFVVGAVALGVLAVERRSSWARVLLWAASALAVAVAYVIKTTPAVVLVALVLLVLVVTLQPGGTAALRRRRLVRGVVGAAAALATFAVGVLGFTATSTAVSGIDTAHVRADVTPPIGWWLANGMNSRPTPAAAPATAATAAPWSTPSREGRLRDGAYARGYIAQRWDERGLPGTVSFYASKAVWNWGDGMFWAWGEGGDAVRAAPVHTGPVAKALWSVRTTRTGTSTDIRADLTQALWLAVLLLAGLGALVVRPRRDVLLMVIVLLGAAGFTLLFQGRSRYIFVFAPVAVTMAAVSLPAVRARLTWPTRVAPRTRRPEGRASVDA